jgi:SAM-dependent methyltransferase
MRGKRPIFVMHRGCREMNPFRLIPRRLKRRMFRYTQAGFPDPASCGAFYDARSTLFSGDDMMALEYSGTDAQRHLFERATSLLPPGGRILDLGCGLGHLLIYLDEKGLSYESYHGIDVSPRMVTEASRRFEGKTCASFEVRDILTEPLAPGSFDTGYILSVLGYPIGDDPVATMMEIIERTFSACREGIVLSHLAPGRKEGLKFTTVPEELGARCEEELGAKAQIDDDGVAFTYLLALRH